MESAQNAKTKQRIAILGAGPAGLSTAYHLTCKPGWEEEYDITIYQMGWRVGGKAASSRSDPEYGSRIEEHGIHLFGNFYLNMFQMLDDCYRTLYTDENGNPYNPEDEPITDLENAFSGCNFQGLPDFIPGHGWKFQTGWLAHNDGDPWSGQMPDPTTLVTDIAYQVIAVLSGKEPWFTPHHEPKTRFGRWLRPIENLMLSRLAKRLDRALEKGVDDHSALLDMLVWVRKRMQTSMRFFARYSLSWRWKYIQLDLITTLIQGIITDEVLAIDENGHLKNDIDLLDQWDYREWLQRHGIDPMTLASGFAQIVPNIGFNYPNGDSTGFPAFSAAPYVYFFIRQVMAEGDALYFFAAGTGDTICAPVYRTLLKRGVKFEFFHKVTDVVPGEDTIDEIRFDVQATTRNGAEYDPMIRVKNMYTWPAKPKFDLLDQGDELREGDIDLESYWTPWKGEEKVIRRGGDGPNDFDYVVMAISIAAHPDVCPKLIEQRPWWKEMVENIEALPTQQLQVWLDKPVEELGWDFGLEGSTNRVVGANYTYPFITFTDFTDLLKWESWPQDHSPKSIIYWSGPLQKPAEWPDYDQHWFPEQQNTRVRATAIQYLRTIRGLLPDSNTNPDQPESLDFNLLHCPPRFQDAEGEDRIDQQFWKVNIDPTERYVSSISGKVGYRPKAWESTYRNMALAGDWCYNGMNMGSIECAATSGALASLALSGYPRVKDIPGADFLHVGFKDPDKPLINE